MIRFIGKSQLQCRQRFKDDLSAHDKRRFPALVKRHITGLLRLLAGHPCFQDAANKTLAVAVKLKSTVWPQSLPRHHDRNTFG